MLISLKRVCLYLLSAQQIRIDYLFVMIIMKLFVVMHPCSCVCLFYILYYGPDTLDLGIRLLSVLSLKRVASKPHIMKLI